MRWRNSCALGLVLAALGAGCGDTAVTPGTGTTQPGASVVGAAGGRVAAGEGAASGASVTIPAGALSSSVTITVREGGAATELPAATLAAGPVVVFGPEGQTFAVPVTVAVPATAGATALYTRAATGGAWSLVEGASWDAATGTMRGSVRHFSMFMALRPAAVPDAGTAVDAGSPPGCASGLADCDGNAANGCETNLTHSAANCGACGTLCPSGRSCVAGVCTSGPSADAGTPTDTGAAVDAGSGPVCAPGYADCNALAADGCEANLGNSASNCGACGALCASGWRCVSGACVGASTDAGTATACPSGRADCDHDPSNGCEVDLTSSASHCGLCGAACPAGRSCAAGVCVGGTPTDGGAGTVCTASYADCDRNAANGCETNLASDRNHCGRCGSACPSTSTCLAGVCESGTVIDGGATPPCASGYGDCDGNAANGCETNLTNNASSCGACGNSCPAGRACSAGVCL